MAVVIIIINAAYYIIFILILARIILSFINAGPYELRDWIYRLTEPILAPIRNVLPPMGGFDFSPMIVIIAASIIRRVLIGLVTT